jgi:uncharacterized membrane protein YgcG
MHTIVIGAAAVKAHLAHGDKLGACQGETATVAVSTDCGTNHGNGGNPHGGTETGEGGSGGGSSDGGGGSGPDTTLNY